MYLLIHVLQAQSKPLPPPLSPCSLFLLHCTTHFVSFNAFHLYDQCFFLNLCPLSSPPSSTSLFVSFNAFSYMISSSSSTCALFILELFLLLFFPLQSFNAFIYMISSSSSTCALFLLFLLLFLFFSLYKPWYVSAQQPLAWALYRGTSTATSRAVTTVRRATNPAPMYSAPLGFIRVKVNGSVVFWGDQTVEGSLPW